MRKNVPSLLESEKNDLFFLRIFSHLKELEGFRESRKCQVFLYPNGQSILCSYELEKEG